MHMLPTQLVPTDSPPDPSTALGEPLSFDDWRVDPSSPVPLYHQVAQLLRAQIKSSGAKGLRIPPEMQLVETLRVSRATVRKAVDMLKAEGLLYGRRGLGTFVVDPRLHRTIKLVSLWEDIVSSGHRVRTDVLHRGIEDASADVAERLRIDPGAPVIAVQRLRFSGERPFSLMRNWHPLALCAGLLEADLSQRSLYEVLRTDCQVVLEHARQTLQARLPDDDEARLLALKPSDPVMRTTRQSFTPAGIVAEWADHVYPANLCVFTAELRT